MARRTSVRSWTLGLKSMKKDVTSVQAGRAHLNAFVEGYKRTLRYGWLASRFFESFAPGQEEATRGLKPYHHERSPYGIRRHHTDAQTCIG